MHSTKLLVGACAAFLINSLPSVAADLGGIAVHGSLSGTAAYSDKYNYMGDTNDKFDVVQREITLNGAYRFENGLRASAQVYALNLTGYSSLSLDFASLDYKFNSYLGLRVGRNKVPQGFYNEVQDLDQVRIFASLPLAFYPRSTRPLGAGFNGASLYGAFDFGPHGGSLEYQVFAGEMNNISKDEPYAKGLSLDTTTSQGLELKRVYGIAPVWNTPLEGLRVGYSYQILDNLVSHSRLKAAPFDVTAVIDTEIQIGSIEYTHAKWSAAAEYKTMRNAGTSSIPALGPTQVNRPTISASTNWYGQLTYQATTKAGFGVYYGYEDKDPKDLVANKLKKVYTLKDTALATSYALTPWCLVKAEYHFLDGVADRDSYGTVNPPPASSDPKWNLFIIKTTLSF